MPAEHSFKKLKPSICNVSPDGENVLLLRPAKVSQFFGTGALMDGLFHTFVSTSAQGGGALKFLNDQKTQVWCGLAAMDFYCHGTFIDEAKKFLRNRRLDSPGDLLTYLGSDKNVKILVSFCDSVMSMDRSMSETEIRCRLGAYQQSVMIVCARDFAERNGGTDVENIENDALRDFLRLRGLKNPLTLDYTTEKKSF